MLGLGLPIYSYAVYPIVLFASASVVQLIRDLGYLVKRGDRRRRQSAALRVSVIIAAYNEEAVIERTLAHCTAVDYPPEQIEILVGSDGSDDGTVEAARRVDGVRVLPFDQRRGKLAVLRDCVAEATGESAVDRFPESPSCRGFRGGPERR